MDSSLILLGKDSQKEWYKFHLYRICSRICTNTGLQNHKKVYQLIADIYNI